VGLWWVSLSQKNYHFMSPVPFLSDEHLAPGVKEFLTVVNSGGSMGALSVSAARQGLVDLQKAFAVDYSGIEESSKAVAVDGFVLNLNVVRPSGVKGEMPGFIFVHGGGWVLDGLRLAIVGNSAGGNMAGATSLMAREKKGPLLRLQVLMWPATDASFTEESYQAFGADRFLTTPLMKWSWDQYTSDLGARAAVYASLLNASVEQLKGLPPTLIQVAENDILRDEGEAFGRKLALAGVTVTTVRYNGMIHDWGMVNGLAGEAATKSLIRHAASELRHYLG
jgi:acetyl esterase